MLRLHLPLEGGELALGPGIDLLGGLASLLQGVPRLHQVGPQLAGLPLGVALRPRMAPR